MAGAAPMQAGGWQQICAWRQAQEHEPAEVLEFPLRKAQLGC